MHSEVERWLDVRGSVVLVQFYSVARGGNFGFIWWLIIGLIAGALTRLIMPGKDSTVILATMLLGIVGSIVGGFVVSLLWRTETGLHEGGLILSALGAILVLSIWRMIRSRNTV